MPAQHSIQHFSTGALPPGMRFDYWMSILRQSLWPVTKWTVPRDFNVQLWEAPLGCLSSMTEAISPSDAYRTPRDVDNTGDPCYLLFVNKLPWFVAHRDHCESYAPGEAVLVDSQSELQTSAPSGFQGGIIKLPLDWMRSWIPDPESLVGRRIAWDSKWARTFLPMVGQLTPELAASPPLPHGILVDQMGAVLALMVGEAEARAVPDLLKTIQDHIRQRCAEPQLTAADVAASLNVPERILHRALASKNLTFASLLLDARISVALEMLTSASCMHLTNSEIAHQAGFSSASYFARIVRKRTGHTPLQLRRSTR